MMGWSPGQFWGASLPEFTAMADGFARFHGAKPEPERFGRDDLADLMERYPD